MAETELKGYWRGVCFAGAGAGAPGLRNPGEAKMNLQRRVLIVSSNPERREMLTGVAVDWDLEVRSASTLEQAVAILGDQNLALAFCEGSLPDGTFRGLLDATSSRRPPLRLIVLVDNERDYFDAVRLGAFEALPTPLRRSDLQWMMIHALRNDPTRRLEEPSRTA
jgi:DNA-binding NtrC family response regulator